MSPVADQQCRAQMGHRDSRGDLQHAHAAGGAGCREGQAGPRTYKPDGSPDYGVFSYCVIVNVYLLVFEIFFEIFFNFQVNK